MPDKIEKLIKQYLDSIQPTLKTKRGVVLYPTSMDIYHYLQDELTGQDLERMLTFLRDNSQGQALVRQARKLLEKEGAWDNEKIGNGEVERAKSLMRGSSKTAACPHCGKPITPFRKPLAVQKWANLGWMMFALTSFLLSFLFKRYFIQFLVVTVLAGVQWIVEMRATKIQILIYKALLDPSEDEHQRLHQHPSRL